MFKHFCLIFIIIQCSTSVYAATLSPTEKKISQTIAKEQKQQLKFLEKLVNINSGTNNIPGVIEVGNIVKTEFEKIGFKTHWANEPQSLQRAATLVAEHRGKRGKRILLIAHLDTVFPKNSPFQTFKRKANVAMGPGIIDDKGGIVVILDALKALKSVQALQDASITVVLPGDEEDSGKPTTISRKPLFRAAKNSDVALDFECAITLNTATVGRRGVANWQINTKGNSTHSATIFTPDVGYGAIFEVARILNDVRTQLAGEKNFTFNPGLILGGTELNFNKSLSQGTAFGKENVIAKLALARGDFRFVNAQQRQNAQQKITAIVQNHLKSTKAEVVFEDGIPSMDVTAGNLNLLKQYSDASIALGYGAIKPLDPGLRGAGDISHIAAIVPANLAGLGPLGSGAHSIHEILDINSLKIQTQRAAILIYRLLQ